MRIELRLKSEGDPGLFRRFADDPVPVVDNGSVTGSGNGTSGEPSEH